MSFPDYLLRYLRFFIIIIVDNYLEKKYLFVLWHNIFNLISGYRYVITFEYLYVWARNAATGLAVGTQADYWPFRSQQLSSPLSTRAGARFKTFNYLRTCHKYHNTRQASRSHLLFTNVYGSLRNILHLVSRQTSNKLMMKIIIEESYYFR